MATNAEIIDIWKKVVEVQKHFNDICIRLRAIAITVITAFIAALSYAFLNIQFIDEFIILTIPVFIAWMAFYIMDLFWYHKLLYGAVMHGIENIEEKHKEALPEICLATSIRDEAYNSILKSKASFKLHLFYFLGFFIILLPWLWTL
ncbi:MAG: hypothetical protein AAGB32_02005 [Pseudomonadota bacterium]